VIGRRGHPTGTSGIPVEHRRMLAQSESQSPTGRSDVVEDELRAIGGSRPSVAGSGSVPRSRPAATSTELAVSHPGHVGSPGRLDRKDPKRDFQEHISAEKSRDGGGPRIPSQNPHRRGRDMNAEEAAGIDAVPAATASFSRRTVAGVVYQLLTSRNNCVSCSVRKNDPTRRTSDASSGVSHSRVLGRRHQRSAARTGAYHCIYPAKFPRPKRPV